MRMRELREALLLEDCEGPGTVLPVECAIDILYGLPDADARSILECDAECVRILRNCCA